MTSVRRDTMVAGDARFFVWLKGTKGPEPQIWYGDQKNGTGQFRYGPVDPVNGPLLVFEVLAGPEWDFSIDKLSAKYPAPGSTNEARLVEDLEALPLDIPEKTTAFVKSFEG